MSKYRIIKDNYAGYEVQQQKRFLFFKWWKEVKKYGSINTFNSIIEAKEWIYEGCPHDDKFKVVAEIEL